MESLKLMLAAIHRLCRQHGETDAVQLAQAVGLPREQVCSLLEQIDELGLASMDEFGFSCSVEYTIYGLTDWGLVYLHP